MASFVETQGHAGDEGNFEALYSTYRSEVQRLASYLLRNTADAEDASQTVFVNVLRALRQGARPAEPRAWLMAITRNVCFSRRRAAAARPDEVELDPERVPEQNGGDAPSVDDIVGALARMLPNQRTALILRDFRGAPHSEICELMELSAAGAETLLTRARVSFREEIEAGEQPFDCVETKALVEQQLAGMISASERHSLRTHLRHCASCSTLARAVRSSRGKLAGLIFWPTELFSRLAGALSQAPTAVHVAAAVTSTAAVATVAIPVAVMNGPAADHIEGRAAAAPALVQPAIASASRPASTASASHSVASHAGPAVHAGTRVHARTHEHARTHGHATHAVPAKKHSAAAASVKVAATGSIASSGAGATDTPRTAAPIVASSPRQLSPPTAATAPAAQPVAVPPRSSSPAARPSSKRSAKAKTRSKTKPKVVPRRRSGGRHPTDPADGAPRSQAPAASMPPPANGADNGAGPGFSSGSSSTSSGSPPSTSSSTSSSSGSSPGGRSNASNVSSGSDGSDPAGPDDHHKKPKH